MTRKTRSVNAGASRLRIIAALAERGPLSRSELASLSGIGAATVGTQVRRLLHIGLVREGEPHVVGTGRPRVPIELLDHAGLIGVSLEPTQVVAVVTTLSGKIVADHRVPFDPALRGVAPIAEAVRSVMAEAELDECLAVGVSLSGVVDAHHDAVLVSVVLNWHDKPIGSMISAELGLPVYVENDVLALASRELSFASLARDESFLLVSLGAGVGMAIVTGRQVFRGGDTSSTEFGHICVQPGGDPCRCGSIGCLQTVAGLEELIAAAPLSSSTPRTLDALAAAVNDSDAVRDYLHGVGLILGRAIGGATTLLGIRTVLITGETTQLWPYLTDGVDQALREHSTTLRSGARLSPLTWSDTAAAAGAAGLALARALDSIA